MRPGIFLLFTFFYVYANSQNLIDFGIRGDASINVTESKFFENATSIRVVLTYDSKDFQYFAGPVFSDKAKLVNSFPESRLRLTGGIVGIRYYKRGQKKGAFYYFLENMLLNYKSFGAYDYLDPYPSKLMHLDSNESNSTFILQPILGCGGEAKCFNFITFSIDLGCGLTYRKMKYDYGKNYPTSALSFTTQVKLSLGLLF